MGEKRKHRRYECSIKAEFRFYEGNPDDVEYDQNSFSSGKGTIMDVSSGGLFIVTNSKVNINSPVSLSFKSKRGWHDLEGRVVRTGLMKNNPTELAVKYSHCAGKGEAYLAVEFDSECPDFTDGC